MGGKKKERKGKGIMSKKTLLKEDERKAEQRANREKKKDW